MVYVEACYVLLADLDSKLSDQSLSDIRMKIIKKRFLCVWKMHKQLYDMFKLSSLFVFTQFTINLVYIVVVQFLLAQDSILLVSSFFLISFSFSDAFICILTCQKTRDHYESIRGKLLQNKRVRNPRLMEGFSLQMSHQDIEMKPLDMISIDNDFLVEVF